MGLIDWRIVVAVGAMALVVALVGLRGRKADALPRCKRRRCRYDLSAFIGVTKPGAPYPVTCPECGRVAQGEREVKWGRRKARRRVAWFGAVVLALCAMVGGVEVYARATNANTLAWMPLWLIMDRAETDTAQNGLVHRLELLRRVEEDEVKGAAANRVIARLLEWQQDGTLEWELLGDVFASLALNGHASQWDVNSFWANLWMLRVHIRPVVGESDLLPIFVTGEWRGPSTAVVVSALFHRYLSTPSTATGMPLNEPHPPLLTDVSVRIGDTTMTGTALRTERTLMIDVLNNSAQPYAPISRKRSVVWQIGGPYEDTTLSNQPFTMQGVRHGLTAGNTVEVSVDAVVAIELETPTARFGWSTPPPDPMRYWFTSDTSAWTSRWRAVGERTVDIRPQADRLEFQHDPAIEDWLQRSLQPVVVRRLSNSPSPGYAVYLELRGDATPPPPGWSGAALRATFTLTNGDETVTRCMFRPEWLMRSRANISMPRIWVGNIESDSAELVVELDEDGAAYTSDLIGVPRFRVFWEIGRIEGSRP